MALVRFPIVRVGSIALLGAAGCSTVLGFDAIDFESMDSVLGEEEDFPDSGEGGNGGTGGNGGATVPPTGDCESGSSQCGEMGTADRFVCSSTTNTWKSSPCPEGAVCVDKGSQVSCKATVCTPAAARCASTTDREVCDELGTAWVSESCESDEACVGKEPDAACKVKTCQPNQRSCSSDALSISICDTSGTQLTKQPCSQDQTCEQGECKSTSATLGDVVMVTAANSPFPLRTGRYAMAVADTDSSGVDDLPYPAQIGGGIIDAVGSPIQEPQSLKHTGKRLSCGASSAMKAALSLPRPEFVPRPPPPGPSQVGDIRDFHVPSADGKSVTVREGRLRAEGASVYFWEDQTDFPSGSIVSDSVLADLVKRIDQGVVARNRAILGALTDVDGNGKVDVFFTNLLPRGHAAAFVNPVVTLFPSGTFGIQSDYGEVVYSMGPDQNTDAATLGYMLAHETGHLISFGRRMAPYLSSGPNSMPDWVADPGAYAEEGIAGLVADWSGQYHDFNIVEALPNPAKASLALMVQDDYATDSATNGWGYGLSALIVGYLFDQAGAVSISGPGSVNDLGGIAYTSALSSRHSGLDRFAPLDGRTANQWYPDMAAALLLTTLEGQVSSAADNDPRYHFKPAQKDSTFGGFNGVPLYKNNAPLVQRRSWSQRGGTLKRGGMSFVEYRITSASTLTISRSTTTTALVRYAD